MESILDDIAQKRQDTQAEIKALQTKMDSLVRDLNLFDKIEAKITGQSLTVLKAEIRTKKPQLPPGYLTIKQMVLLVLQDHPNGLVALDILTAINLRFEENFLRTSLSPQLSRLRQSGDIHKSDKRWILGAGNLGEPPM